MSLILLLIAQEVSFEEKRLARLPDGVILRCAWFADHGRVAAFVATLEGKEFAVFGERRGEDHWRVGPIRFSMDGKSESHVAWDWDQKIQAKVVLDGKDQPYYDSVMGLGYIPNSRGVWYIGAHGVNTTGLGRGGTWFLHLDSEKFGPYDSIGPPIFSKTWACVAMRRNKPLVLQGGVELAGYDLVSRLSVSPKGEIAFLAKKDRKAYLVVGDQEREIPDWTTDEFSEFPTQPDLLFGPDGQAVWRSRDEGGLLLRWGDRELGKGQSITMPAFSREGAVAFAVTRGEKTTVVQGKRTADVGDGSRVDALRWNPVKESLAYRELVFRSENRCRLVVDGTPTEWYPEMGAPIFSPDGRHIAFRARVGSRHVVVTDGHASEEFYEVTDPQFNAEGTKVAFGARTGSELWWKVLDVK